MDEGELSDGLSEWELIQAPAHSTPLITPLAEQHMVATATTKDNSPQHQHHLSVFPPSCRDGLEEEEEVNSSVTSWSMIKGDGANSWSLKNTSAIGKILTNGALKLAARVGYYVGFGWGVWSGNIVVAAMLLSFLYAKVRLWGGRVKKAKKDPLIRLIQENDQKMKQLLFQIGEMNEILLSAGRRRVPVVRLSC
ncbi:hypothetical protein ES319_A03G113600v1 [Gossypium barbadense]|uniref:Uncharacterized protein n=1 Tax=Gossypium barbadense TaxID=3634 RepID=A0A2P5YKD5_GOSBA|nr:hypothetical protein ES319_A03G113600v1 [Gossypium barbadense]PPS16065.1 hypothetical protein GOBAR_AA04495 [Gossypium barbadense]